MQFKREKSIYTQIVEYIKYKIFSEEVALGQKLPPIRELALILKVNPNTVVHAYAELEKEEFIFTESTNGKFVTRDKAFILIEKNKYINKITLEYLEITNKCKYDIKKVIKIMEDIDGKQF